MNRNLLSYQHNHRLSVWYSPLCRHIQKNRLCLCRQHSLYNLHCCSYIRWHLHYIDIGIREKWSKFAYIVYYSAIYPDSQLRWMHFQWSHLYICTNSCPLCSNTASWRHKHLDIHQYLQEVKCEFNSEFIIKS